MPNPPPRRPGEPDTVTYNINPSDSRFPAYAISARQSDFPSLERSFARLTRRQYSPLAQFLETAKNQGLRVLLHVNYAIGERAEWNAASNTWSDRIVSTAGERATTIYNSSSSNILQGVTKDPSSSYDVVIILNYDKMSSGDVWDSFSTSVTIGHEFGHAVNPIVFRNSRQFSSDGFRQHLTVTGPALARVYRNFGLNVAISIKERNGNTKLYVGGPTANLWSRQNPDKEATVVSMEWILSMAGSHGLGGELNESDDVIDLGEAQFDTYYSTLGAAIGSSLGNALSRGQPTVGIIYSTLLGEIGNRLAFALDAGMAGDDAIGAAVLGGLGRLGSDIAIRASDAAIGTVSSWLSMELGESLGLNGFGAELFTTVGSTVTNHIVGNLLAQGPNFALAGINTQAVGEALGGATKDTIAAGEGVRLRTH